MVFEAVTRENIICKAGKNHLLRQRDLGVENGEWREIKLLVHDGKIVGMERMKVKLAGKSCKRCEARHHRVLQATMPLNAFHHALILLDRGLVSSIMLAVKCIMLAVKSRLTCQVNLTQY